MRQRKTHLRFKRPGKIEGMWWDALAQDVLHLFYLHRFVTARQVERILGLKRRAANHRLRVLWHNGYLERPEQHTWVRTSGEGSRPIIHALTNKGMAKLVEAGRAEPDTIDRNEKNRRLGKDGTMYRASSSIPHEWLISECVASFEEWARERGERVSYFSNNLSIPSGENITPDKVFQIGDTVFFLEVDRDTEPNVRKPGDKRQSLKRKDEKYAAYFDAGQFEEDFGKLRSRVIKVVKGGEQKLKNVAGVSFSVVGASERFLCQAVPCEPSGVWLSPSGEEISLSIGKVSSA